MEPLASLNNRRPAPDRLARYVYTVFLPRQKSTTSAVLLPYPTRIKQLTAVLDRRRTRVLYHRSTTVAVKTLRSTRWPTWNEAGNRDGWTIETVPISFGTVLLSAGIR